MITVAEKERTPLDELEWSAALVVTSLSQRNLKNTGGTYTVTVPRHKIERLHAALEAMYPGWTERIYEIKRQERAKAAK